VRPFTVAQAQQRGLTPRQLQSRRWRQVLRGVWVSADAPDTRELRIEAVGLVLPPRAVVCTPTAAWLWGGPTLRDDDLDVYVLCPNGSRLRSRPGLRVVQGKTDASEVVLWGSVRVTSATRTAYDCLHRLSRRDGLVLADALTHLRRPTLLELTSYTEARAGMRGNRIVRQRLAEVEPLTESPMETLTRLVLVDGGLPRPVAQHEVYDADGCFVARLDLAYPWAKVAVEYDGAQHWTQRRDDDRRRDRLRALGWTIIVVSASDIYREPDHLVVQVAAALQARAA
jgi:Protein of unknown function (DUF559)